jgi:hypothetical protein
MRFFLATGLPRSRTTWLSRFLTFGDVCCLHEPSIFFRQLRDLDRLVAAPATGASDAMMSLLWREIVARCPETRFVVVRRPVDEVLVSAVNAGFKTPQLPFVFERLGAACDFISALPGTVTVSFADLEREEVCARVFRHCLDAEMPSAWWRYWGPVKVECDIAAQQREFDANTEGIRRVYFPYLKD